MGANGIGGSGVNQRARGRLNVEQESIPAGSPKTDGRQSST